MAAIDPIVVDFPNLQLCAWKITSDADENYNCIGWAAGLTTEWWWPDPFETWPSGVPMEETIDAFPRHLQRLVTCRAPTGHWKQVSRKSRCMQSGLNPSTRLVNLIMALGQVSLGLETTLNTMIQKELLGLCMVPSCDTIDGPEPIS